VKRAVGGVVRPDEEDRLLTVAEIRAAMRRAMTKAAYYGEVIFFGPYSRGDFLTDVDIMVVVDRLRRRWLTDCSDVSECIDREHDMGTNGVIVHVVKRSIFDRFKGERSTVYWEADHYGIRLFDNRRPGVRRQGPRPKHLRRKGEDRMFLRKRNEDKEDAKAADQVWEGVQAGERVYTHDEVKSVLGMRGSSKKTSRRP
jgi:predicted nucleotidyltransferase